MDKYDTAVYLCVIVCTLIMACWWFEEAGNCKRQAKNLETNHRLVKFVSPAGLSYTEWVYIDPNERSTK